ncbi:methylated-DNA--protein-cysteine methyltransferase isoform X3 [Opisthocomus hoazin]|uniref:methylated-DNA--protein-cysteine methyltransferase isoform X3 n=1 Tax=Opisthocomus hoazin TaxID=30419 RepID=UPI003F5321B2
MAAANLPPSRQRGERFGGAGAARRRPGFRGAAGGSSPGSGQVGAGRKTRVCCWYRSRAWRLQSSYDPVTAQFSKQSGKLSSTMASRLVRKVNSKEGEPPCKERRAILLSPVGKIEISGCEKGLHEIKLPKTSVLPSRVVHQPSAVDPVEGREVWRGRVLQAISSARGQQQSGESGGRSDEEQSYGHCHTLPQGDLQQRPDRQLRSGKPDERVAAVAREAPEREVSVATQRSRSCQPAKARRRGFLATNELSEHPAEFREMVNI